MIFDVVFLDVSSPKYYDRITLEKEALGGSEASVIRIAEGLGSLGLKVAVIEAKIKNYFTPIIGQHAFFFHSDDVDKVKARHYIQIRANTNPQLFPGSKKYIWLHDVSLKGIEDQWIDSIKQYNIQLIGVSRWHKNNIKEVTGLDNVEYIYNPVPDEIYIDANTTLEYDRNTLVWPASPHKGLKEAASLFKQLRSYNSKFQLIVFNPGYKKLDGDSLMVQPGISIYGSMSCRQVWSVIQKSLCVFYPTSYLETFGLIAAEANALGTPIATNGQAGLKETVTQKLVDTDQNVVDTVIDWSVNGRPKVVGNSEFKLSNILVDWVKLLAR